MIAIQIRIHCPCGRWDVIQSEMAGIDSDLESAGRSAARASGWSHIRIDSAAEFRVQARGVCRECAELEESE